jgi:hypothetical protein
LINAMKHTSYSLPAFFSCLVALATACLLSGCIVSPVGSSGGIGATTVTDSNPTAIISAANQAFSSAGYSMGPADYPDSVSFDKQAGGFGQAMYGGWNDSVTYRAKLNIVPVSGAGNYRIGVNVSHVNETGMAGMDDAVPMTGLWSAEFAPLLRQIRQQASGAGPY